MNNTISIIGLGKLGCKIVNSISPDYKVYGFDLDSTKTNSINNNKFCFVSTVEQALDSEIIILALSKPAILDFFKKYYSKVSRNTICVNMCSFILLDDIIDFLYNNNIQVLDNICSCKLIGHFENLNRDSCLIIANNNCEHNESLGFCNLFLNDIAVIQFDDEKKYLNLNMLVAETAIEAVLKLSIYLKMNDFNDNVIMTSIQTVFSETAKQYPYNNIEKDYFLNKLMNEKPHLNVLLQQI